MEGERTVHLYFLILPMCTAPIIFRDLHYNSLSVLWSASFHSLIRFNSIVNHYKPFRQKYPCWLQPSSLECMCLYVYVCVSTCGRKKIFLHQQLSFLCVFNLFFPTHSPFPTLCTLELEFYSWRVSGNTSRPALLPHWSPLSVRFLSLFVFNYSILVLITGQPLFWKLTVSVNWDSSLSLALWHFSVPLCCFLPMLPFEFLAPSPICFLYVIIYCSAPSELVSLFCGVCFFFFSSLTSYGTCSYSLLL